ncbi:MAG: hypothetical protein ACYSWQ_11135 [Planctomycetota bacterium]|jgi:hypothetical protein
MEPDKHAHAEKTASPPGVTGQRRRLKADTAATAEELRKFVARMHGKSPQEVLGAVAESGLTKGIVTSAIGAFVILVVFTVGPFLVNKISADVAPAATTKPQPVAAQAQAAPTPSEAQEQSAEPEVVPDETDLEKATDAMGIGETKPADPDTNPLDNKLDSLLDGVD